MIEASHLAKRFGAIKAVDDLSFRIEPGEIVGLLGRNGAGKTTTLHMLAGITRPDAGQIRVCGIDLLEQPKLAKACLGFIADEPEFFEYLTVEEHLKFSGMLFGIRDAAAADGLISRFGLEDKRHAFPEELSRGMRQKLALACVLHHDPKAILLDEPLTGLDPAGMRDMKDTILARAREGAAVILSSHLLFLVEELCSRLLIVHDGRLVASGTMQEIRGAAGGAGGSRELEAAFLDITSRPAASGV